MALIVVLLPCPAVPQYINPLKLYCLLSQNNKFSTPALCLFSEAFSVDCCLFFLSLF